MTVLTSSLLDDTAWRSCNSVTQLSVLGAVVGCVHFGILIVIYKEIFKVVCKFNLSYFLYFRNDDDVVPVISRRSIVFVKVSYIYMSVTDLRPPAAVLHVPSSGQYHGGTQKEKQLEKLVQARYDRPCVSAIVV